MKKDITIIERIFREAGFGITSKPSAIHSILFRMHTRNNPDGSIRWAWPAGSPQPNFLKFYTNGTLRSGIFSKLIRLLFKAGAGRLFSSGTQDFYFDSETMGSLEEKWGNEFALFTGTPGPNRKGLVWYNDGTQGVFIKIALDENSAGIIKRERGVLKELQAIHLNNLQVPRLISSEKNAISLSDLSVNGGKRAAYFTKAHALALQELYKYTAKEIRIDQTSWWSGTIRMLEELSLSTDSRLPKGMIRKLQYLSNSIPSGQLISCGLAHGDFTPWNMYVNGEEIKLYDWELSIPDAPAYWDAFHFLFQSGILMHRQTTKKILGEVAALDRYDLTGQISPGAKNTDPVPMGKRPDAFLHLRLYLLMNCSYYLRIYSMQPQWHLQVEWLLRSWSEALDDVLRGAENTGSRQLVCMDLFDHLQNKPYAALKWTTALPEEVSESSDIDFCVDKKLVPGLDRFFRQHPLVASCHFRKSSFMKNYEIILEDDTLLSIDLIWQCRRKDLEMIRSTELLSSRKADIHGVQTPSMEMDARYTSLFFLLNKASVPEKYRLIFQKSDWSFAFDYHQDIHAAILKKLRSKPENRGWRSVRNKVLYFTDVCGNFFRRGGFVVTFSGVDGAGKSTIIEKTRIQLEKQFRRKTIVLRHRPSLLPILSAWKHGKAAAEKKSAGTLPRQGQNRSGISSLFRFAYYYFDYLFGQFYIRLKYVSRGYVVLYDRYYFDFINDSRRSNIRLSPAFTGWFYRFLIKPELNFFLYASPEEILQRKQELDAVTIRELTEKYMRLFGNLSRQYNKSKYIPIHNQHLEDTMATIVGYVRRRAS